MLLKVQVEGAIQQVWNYIHELQFHPFYDLLHKELIQQKFTDEYIQVMCYLKQVQGDPSEDLTVSLTTKEGQTIKLPLQDAMTAKFGDQVLVIGYSLEAGENRS